MASRTVTLLEDDIDGGEAAETIRFCLDGHAYEIDLSSRNAAKMRNALAVYIENGRRLGGRQRQGTTPPGNPIDSKAVRGWAVANGIDVSARGRIPADVLLKYREARR